LFGRMRKERGRSTQPMVLLLAAVGCALLVHRRGVSLGTPSDEFAYWLGAQRLAAGQPLYDQSATLVTPYAYLYPPPLAQVLAPFTHFLPDAVYVAAWTVLLLIALLYLGGWSPLRTLRARGMDPGCRGTVVPKCAPAHRGPRRAGPPRAALGVRGGAAIKIAPALGVVYFLSARRWRDALVAAGAGVGILAVSFVLAPGAWRDSSRSLREAGAGSAGLLPVPFWVRAMAGIILAVVAGRARPRVASFFSSWR